MLNTGKPAVAYYAAIRFIVESSNTRYLQNITLGRVVLLIFTFYGSDVLII